MTIYRVFLAAAIAVLLTLTGCSDANKNVVFDPGKGHPAGWLPKRHMDAATADMATCAECHGADYAGGIANVSCTGCHIGGADSVHPQRWSSNVSLYHRWYAFKNGTSSCENAFCHGADLKGVSQSGVSCENCHAPGYIPTTAKCSSCHGFPPSGTAFYDTAGKHSQHTALQDTACFACHTNNHAYLGTAGTATSASGVHMEFSTLFSAKSGTATYDPASNTCSAVSCHGGQQTLSWLTATTFNVSTQCTSCHAFGIAEYNSFNSGQHDWHVNDPSGPLLVCTACHDTTKLAVNHFTSLTTSALEGPASATLKDALHYDGVSCTPSCHVKQSWQ